MADWRHDHIDDVGAEIPGTTAITAASHRTDGIDITGVLWLLTWLNGCGTRLSRRRADTPEPSEQCWVMRSVGWTGLVGAVPGIEHCA
jgi:hypothetical protein